MDREKNVSHLLGILCLAVALQFFPAQIWAETNVLPVVSQQKSYALTGNIVDGKGEPIIGANVVLKGSATGVVTDVDGNFSMNVSEKDVLMISYIGYNSLEIPVKGQKSLNIVMKENVESLDEIVVIGYGTMKKKDLTGSVSAIKADEITAFTVSNPIQALQGRVPGVVPEIRREIIRSVFEGLIRSKGIILRFISLTEYLLARLLSIHMISNPWKS